MIKLSYEIVSCLVGSDMVIIYMAYSGRAASEAEENRLVVRFGTEWRTFIRRQTPDRLTALDELIDERIERRALARFYRRMKHAAVVVVTAFALAQFGVDRLPLVRQLWRLVRGDLR
nr:hypothetical protein [Methylobacterium sp. WL103]